VARYKKMRRSDFKIATDGVIGFELSERDLNARRRRVVARAGLHRERARQAQTSRLRLGLADRLFLDEKKGYLKRIKAPIKFTGPFAGKLSSLRLIRRDPRNEGHTDATPICSDAS
jgi:hypothetical protein